MNAQNKTDTIVIPKFTATPIVTVMNIKQVSAKIIVWPAMMLANRRIINANGLVNTPKNSTNGMNRQGQFQVDRRFGPKNLFPIHFRGEQVDRYKRTKCQYACYRYISRNISASRENRYDPDQVIDQDKEKYRQQIGRERLIFFSDRLFDHPVLYVGDGHFHQSDKSARRLVRVLLYQWAVRRTMKSKRPQLRNSPQTFLVK